MSIRCLTCTQSSLVFPTPFSFVCHSLSSACSRLLPFVFIAVYTFLCNFSPTSFLSQWVVVLRRSVSSVSMVLVMVPLSVSKSRRLKSLNTLSTHAHSAVRKHTLEESDGRRGEQTILCRMRWRPSSDRVFFILFSLHRWRLNRFHPPIHPSYAIRSIRPSINDNTNGICAIYYMIGSMIVDIVIMLLRPSIGYDYYFRMLTECGENSSDHFGHPQSLSSILLIPYFRRRQARIA